MDTLMYNIKDATEKKGVYKITNILNGKVYIGSSAICLSRRICQHRSDLRGNRHRNRHLQNSYNKYGENNFDFEVVEIVESKENVVLREQYWLDKYWGSGCYNMTRDAALQSGYKHSIQAKQKISEASKRLWQEKRDIMVQVTTKANRDQERNNRRSDTLVKQRSQAYQGIILLNPDGEEVVLIGSIKRFAKQNKLHESTLHGLLNRTARHCKGWSLKYHSLPSFISPNGDIFDRVCNIAKLARSQNMTSINEITGLQSLVRGTLKTYKGWRLLCQT